jgi:hypothetical protein
VSSVCQQQGPQIEQFIRRQPDRRKAVFHQQRQNQVRISPVMFLLPWFGRPDFRWMTDLAKSVRGVNHPIARRAPAYDYAFAALGD